MTAPPLQGDRSVSLIRRNMTDCMDIAESFPPVGRESFPTAQTE